MWSDLAAWFASPAGQRAITDAVLPVVAILVAALLAASIARAAVGRLERRIDRESLAAAVAGFVEAARRTAAGDPDPGSAVRLATESDVRLRLSGRPGADVAADWALLVALAARADDGAVIRDRLVAWSRRPTRARRLFGTDLEALQQPGTRTATRPDAPVASGAPREPELPASGAATVAAAAPAEEGLGERPAAVAATDHTNQVRPAPEELPPDQPATAIPPAAGGSGSAQPAWLDDYDDDAHVTRNIPLSTPAPVAASAVRDRSRPGDDILPS